MSPGGKEAVRHVSADRDRCIGSGQCALTAPQVFDSGDDGLVVLTDPDPADELLGAVRAAVRRCPVAALTLHPG